MSKSKAPLIEVLLAKVLERRGWKCKLLPKRKRVGLGAKAATGVVGAALGWTLPDLLRGPQAETLLQTLAQACAVAAQQCRPPEVAEIEEDLVRCAECGRVATVPEAISREWWYKEGIWLCLKCSALNEDDHTEAPANAADPSPST